MSNILNKKNSNWHVFSVQVSTIIELNKNTEYDNNNLNWKHQII